jgi:hypothetical protein
MESSDASFARPGCGGEVQGGGELTGAAEIEATGRGEERGEVTGDRELTAKAGEQLGDAGSGRRQWFKAAADGGSR